MKKILSVSFVFALIFVFFTALGLNAEAGPPVVKSYDLEIEVLPDAELDYAGFMGILYGRRPEWNKKDSLNQYPHMIGKALVTLDLGDVPCDILTFYLHSELRAHSVKFEKTELAFTQKTVYYPSNYSAVATQVQVDLKGLSGEQKMAIEYGGMFNPNYSESPSNYMRIDTEGAYLRGYGYSLWFPVFLEAGKTTYKIDFANVKITTPRKFVGVFTGQRLNEYIKEESRISNWKAENANLWDAQLTARPFSVQERDGIYLYHLDNTKSRESVEDMFAFVGQLKTLYGSHYRVIKATPQLHIAELPNFASGISSGNMIGITSGQWEGFHLKSGDDGLKRLVAHELVHTYVQVPTDRQDPIAALVVEGFPSYFHLPILGEMFGEEWYQKYMRIIEESYLRRKKTKMTRRGNPLPPEKPILSITFDDVGKYKDTFILNDRALLFLNSIRSRLGKKEFKKFTRELCNLPHLDVPLFKETIHKYLPGSEKDIILWLETNDYPDRWHLKK